MPTGNIDEVFLDEARKLIRANDRAEVLHEDLRALAGVGTLPVIVDTVFPRGVGSLASGDLEAAAKPDEEDLAAARRAWQSRKRRILAALGRIPFAVVLIGARGNVVFANGEAVRVLVSADGPLLRRALRSCVPGERMRVARAGAERPYDLEARWIEPVDASGRAAAVVLTSDPDRPRETSIVSRLVRLFGLTAAEAALAAKLAEGVPLSDCARSARVTLHTARSHLKKIFEKTGTHRQGELIARLLHALLAQK